MEKPSDRKKVKAPFGVFDQIDITEGYQSAYRKISLESRENIPRKIKSKLYPEGVKKITYSPQTESIYYYVGENKDSVSQFSWDIFEDRGAILETELIENLIEIDELKRDYDIISTEEKQIEYMTTDEVIDAICNFVKNHGSNAYRYRADIKIDEKCKIYGFQRAKNTEELVLFLHDRYLILRRFEKDNQILQKPIKSMNRTIICWYYEGLLRMKRLEEKQSKFTKKYSSS